MPWPLYEAEPPQHLLHPKNRRGFLSIHREACEQIDHAAPLIQAEGDAEKRAHDPVGSSPVLLDTTEQVLRRLVQIEAFRVILVGPVTSPALST